VIDYGNFDIQKPADYFHLHGNNTEYSKPPQVKNKSTLLLP